MTMLVLLHFNCALPSVISVTFIIAARLTTTGDHEFAVWLETRRHTAKTSPTVADGEAPTAATGTAKTLFAVCQKSGTRQIYSPCVYIGTWRKKRADAVTVS